MGMSKSIWAYPELREAFERAMESDRGIAIECQSHADAIQLRSRFNHFRKLNRADNQLIYPEGHPMHDQSSFERLMLRIPAKGKPDDNTLYIELRTLERLKIRDL